MRKGDSICKLSTNGHKHKPIHLLIINHDQLETKSLLTAGYTSVYMNIKIYFIELKDFLTVNVRVVRSLQN